MSRLRHRIDFMILISVRNANPNGDPLSSGRPRMNSSQHGIISDVCIKRKIRNRMQESGESIFMQEETRADDGCTSLIERTELLKDFTASNACRKWMDIRTFGQLLVEKYTRRNIGHSLGIRGPVSIQTAETVSPVRTTTMQLARSMNRTDGERKDSDTLGTRTTVDYGLYRSFGSISVSLAERTGFSAEDAGKLKECIRSMFLNDASSTRPAGSMEVLELIWWEHPNPNGVCSPAEVMRSVEISLKDGIKLPGSPEDYDIIIKEIPGLVPEIMKGL